MRWDGTDRKAHIKRHRLSPTTAHGRRRSRRHAGRDPPLARRRSRARRASTTSSISYRAGDGRQDADGLDREPARRPFPSRASRASAATSSAGRATAIASTGRSAAASSRTTSRADSLVRDRRIRRAMPTARRRGARQAARDSAARSRRPRTQPTRAGRRDHGAEDRAARHGRAARRAHHHDEGRRDHRARRHRGHEQPHRGRRRRADACTMPAARARSTSPARRSSPASWTSTRTCGRRGASTGRRCASTWRTSRTASRPRAIRRRRTTDVLTYGDLVETGDMHRAAHLHHRARRLLDRRASRASTTRATCCAATPSSTTRRRSSSTWSATARCGSGSSMAREGARTHADARGRARLQEEPDGGDGRLRGHRALVPDHAAVTRTSCSSWPRAASRTRRRCIVLYGGPWAENYWYEHYDIHEDEKLRRFTPHEELDRPRLRRPAWCPRRPVRASSSTRRRRRRSWRRAAASASAATASCRASA